MEVKTSGESNFRIIKIASKELIQDLTQRQEELDEWVKKTKEVVPTDRNFNFEIKKGVENNVGLSLRRNDGATINVNSFIPEGVRFQIRDKYLYNDAEKVVGFPEDQLQYRGSLLSLFHEIGHSKTFVMPSYSFIEKVRAEVVNKLNLFRIINHQGNLEVPQLDHLLHIINISPEVLYPEDLMEKRLSVHEQNEREAWASGLHSLRDLNSKGYNVFAGFESVKDVQAFIAANLTSYNILEHAMTGYESNRFSKRPYK